jgi:asparagine N-glycosylation enzyme membrane subunit Stt3
MTLSLWYLLIPFGLMLVVWLVLSIVAIVKMLRFGFVSRPAIISSLCFVVFSVAVLVGTAVSLHDVDWSASIAIGAPSVEFPSVNIRSPFTP